MATFICLRRLRATAARPLPSWPEAPTPASEIPRYRPAIRGGPALEAVQRKIAAPFAAVPTRAVQEARPDRRLRLQPARRTRCWRRRHRMRHRSTLQRRVGHQREDFCTKLIHGGVRYLEKAVFNLDYGQLKLVFHALEERKQVIENAPHLCNALPCMTPCFDWFEVVYYWMGLKLYDLVAGPRLLHLSRYYSAQESVELFPTLARNACTAALAGAAVLNHAEVITFLKDEGSERIIGARVRDNLTGMGSTIFWHVIANVNLSIYNIACSTTLHKSAKGFLTPLQNGLNRSQNKRWARCLHAAMVGENSCWHYRFQHCDYNASRTTHEDEIEFILDAICDYLNVKVRRVDVLSAWSGIRPLATDPSAKNTESISRDHVVCEDYPGLVTITGGKWTTYRSMAEDAVDAAIKSGKLSPTNKCLTYNLRHIGGDGWDPASFTVLAQQYVRMKKSYGGKVVPGVMDTAAAKHLSHAYGTLAEQVAAIAQNENLGKRLAHGYPFLEAEVTYCARHEYCESAVDFIARRSRLAFLDTDAASHALPSIIQILAAEHKWDKSRQKQEVQKATEFLETFKSSKNAQFHDGKHQ
ncbi:FAD-dependent oxidoreductase family protein [Actinidia rufa]|uniref:glycerol-3-phosphate dehydrogenase n=1 Tax=Actinidia rufa TaxID=165716 RepID=A0A7J0GVD8_9ERIC|nr:FAD-dependent oxidoreductase family protein [Actinidia rufa]